MVTAPGEKPRPGRVFLSPVLAFFLVVVLAFAFQGTRPLYEPDEGRYTNVSLEMLRSGNWLIPHRNYETAHLSKPPLTYWCIASCFKLLGRNTWAARTPMALAFIFTVLAVYGIAKRLVPAAPLLPAIIYATILGPFIAANIITTDSLLTLWDAVAGWCFVSGWWPPISARKRRAWTLAMWGAFGLAFFTKGPPGLLPLGAFVIFLFLSGRGAKWRELFPFGGLVIFILTGLSWYLIVIISFPETLRYFLVEEVFGRFATDRFRRNGEWYGAVMIYVPVLLLGILPWGAVLLLRAKQIIRRLLQFRDPKARQASPELLLLACWVIFSLVIFFLAKSRLPLYVLPLFVPISLLIGYLLRNWIPSRRARIFVLAWVLMLIAIKGAFPLFPSSKNIRQFAVKIKQSIAFNPGEVVFVDTHAKYGLALYLDCSVEAVKSGNPKPLPHDYDSGLKTEIKERCDSIVWIVRRKNTRRFINEMSENGRKVEIAGGYQKYMILVDQKPGNFLK